MKLLFFRLIVRRGRYWAFVHGRSLFQGAEANVSRPGPYGLVIGGVAFKPFNARPHNDQDSDRGLSSFARFTAPLSAGSIEAGSEAIFTRNDGQEMRFAVGSVLEVPASMLARDPVPVELDRPLEVTPEKPLPEEYRGKTLRPSRSFVPGRRTGLVVVRDGGTLDNVGVDVTDSDVRDAVQVLGLTANRAAVGVRLHGLTIRGNQDQFGVSAFGLTDSLLTDLDIVADRQVYGPPNFVNADNVFWGVRCRSYNRRDGQADRLFAGPRCLMHQCEIGPGGRGWMLQNGRCGYHGMAVVDCVQSDLDLCLGGSEGLLFECLGSTQGSLQPQPDGGHFFYAQTGARVEVGQTVVIPSQDRWVMVEAAESITDARGVPCWKLGLSMGVSRAVSCGIGWVPTEVTITGNLFRNSRTGPFFFGASAGVHVLGNDFINVLDPVVQIDRLTEEHFAKHVQYRSFGNESFGHARGPWSIVPALSDLPGMASF